MLENISISEEVVQKSEENTRAFERSIKKLQEKENRINELEKEIMELKSKRVHFDENKILAEFEMRLIRVEGQVSDFHQKLFQPSLTNPKQSVLSTYGKQVKRRLR